MADVYVYIYMYSRPPIKRMEYQFNDINYIYDHFILYCNSVFANCEYSFFLFYINKCGILFIIFIHIVIEIQSDCRLMLLANPIELRQYILYTYEYRIILYDARWHLAHLRNSHHGMVLLCFFFIY